MDVSHAGERTLADVIARSSQPVIASHSNARALCEHPRNLSDEAIRLVAETGGVIGLCAFAPFVSSSARPNLGELLDHAVHIADLVGPEHLGLGFDFADETEDEYEFYGYDERLYPGRPGSGPTASPDSVTSSTSRRRCARAGSPNRKSPASWAETFWPRSERAGAKQDLMMRRANDIQTGVNP